MWIWMLLTSTISKGGRASNFKHLHKYVNNLWLHVAIRNKMFWSYKNTQAFFLWKSADCRFMVHFYGLLSYVVLWLHCLWLHGFIQEKWFWHCHELVFLRCLMQHDYRLCVGYIHVVFLWVNDAYISILWLQIWSILMWPQILHHNWLDLHAFEHTAF